VENARAYRMSDNGCKHWCEQQEGKNDETHTNVSSASDHRATDNIRAEVLTQTIG
jgi:hypothetical protein